MEVRNTLYPYCEALRKGIEAENWYLSLMAALTLPDICVSLEEGITDKNLYVNWFDKYVTQYSPKIHQSKSLLKANTVDEYNEWIKNRSGLEGDDLEEIQLNYFSGVNAYALRCAFLHNGDGMVGTQNIYKKDKFKNATLGINKVRFDTSNANRIISTLDDTATLNPKAYCEAVLEGVSLWVKSNEKVDKVLRNAKNLSIFD